MSCFHFTFDDEDPPGKCSPVRALQLILSVACLAFASSYAVHRRNAPIGVVCVAFTAAYAATLLTFTDAVCCLLGRPLRWNVWLPAAVCCALLLFLAAAGLFVQRRSPSWPFLGGSAVCFAAGVAFIAEGVAAFFWLNPNLKDVAAVKRYKELGVQADGGEAAPPERRSAAPRRHTSAPPANQVHPASPPHPKRVPQSHGGTFYVGRNDSPYKPGTTVEGGAAQRGDSNCQCDFTDF